MNCQLMYYFQMWMNAQVNFNVQPALSVRISEVHTHVTVVKIRYPTMISHRMHLNAQVCI